MSDPLRLGFACNWDPQARSTWSYTPWNLRQALRQRTEVVDVGIRLPRPARLMMKAAFARRYQKRWISNWKHSRVSDALCQGIIERGVNRTGCDAVLEIQDLAIPSVPFFVLQDLTFDILLHVAAENDGRVPHFPGLSPAAISRRRDRQHKVYERATGVLVMSRWAASTLVDWSNLPPTKVHVVYPGRTVSADVATTLRVDRRPRRRMLIVGKDFYTKAGDVVVRSLEILRRRYDSEITLTVAGPSVWPLSGDIPPGVTFLGRVPVEQVARLYQTHDILVMPSRLEGFGIVFVEALAHGLPCVGRRAFAMPEIIVPGENGALVDGDDPDALADAVAGVLSDDAVYETCARQATDVAARFTWSASADQAIDAIRSGLGV